MEIRQIDRSKEVGEWNYFIFQNSSPAAFLQSFVWGEFKKDSQNESVLRYAMYEKGELVGIAQLVKRALPGGRFYLNCQRGPVIKKGFEKKALELLKTETEKIGKQEKIVFIRIAPPYEKIDAKLFKKPKILKRLKEPEQTLVLNLQKNEQELLQSMHAKTRYNIRLSEKKDIQVKIYEDVSEREVSDFFYLSQQTSKRDKINIFSKKYYQDLLNMKDGSFKVNLFTAYHQNKALSSIIVVGFGDTATYFYGASSNEHRNLMPNYAVQWTAIRWAKENGYKWYDFWGVSDDKKSSWYGITRFKQGFVGDMTGKQIKYVHTTDLVLNNFWYNIYTIAKIFT